MTYDEMITIIQAVKEGKAVQIKFNEGWHDCSGKIDFNFISAEYRVKPELREFWINEYTDCFGSLCIHRTKEAADKGQRCNRVRCFKVVECINDTSEKPRR